VDQRTHIRRLKQFAVIGHQPGFNAIRTTTEHERRQIEIAIMRQRVGTSSKQASATMRSVHASRDEGEMLAVKLKRAKLDMKSTPQWSRTFRTGLIEPVTVLRPYSSRMITCRACGQGKETAHMQLLMPNGFRGICCPGCHRQARVSKNLCQCQVIWHQCPTHKHDPAVHRSEKPSGSSSATMSKTAKDKLSLHRMAPEAIIKRRPAKRRKVEGPSGSARLHSHGLGAGSATETAPQLDATLQPRLAAKFPHLATRRGSRAG
jgi:hypothetical protein